ncbi:MAG TPA: NYN domain-containing protein [Candidatus Limnocylindrales bacterium]|nr:NYN domain-containing protein [Candidatus Limnocylindrales bacterium]
MDRLIVDGYNVIFAWPQLSALKDVKLEDARDLLIAVMADYAALTHQQVTIVFDSHRRPDGEGSTQQLSGVEVIFSGRKRSADHVIERLIYQARAADEVTVATSDAVQRDLALGKGVKTISAMLLKAQVEAVISRRDVDLRDRQARSDLSRRLEDRLDPRTRDRLDRMRRGEDPTASE